MTVRAHMAGFAALLQPLTVPPANLAVHVGQALRRERPHNDRVLLLADDSCFTFSKRHSQRDRSASKLPVFPRKSLQSAS